MNRTRYLKAFLGIGVCLAALGALILLTTAGSKRPAPAPVGAAPPGMLANSALPAVTIREALKTIGREVPLPNTTVTGPYSKVMVDPTAGDLSGHPGLFIIYRSGVRLTVDRRIHDTNDLQAVSGFTDGRKTHFETLDMSGTTVLVGRAGLQKTAHGDNPVPAMLIWNQDGLGYILVGPGSAIDDLLTIMRSTG
jgi:hypothetical protein